MPKNPNGTGTIRKRPNGTWEARVCTGRDPATGKLIRKSVYGRTQRDVSKQLREISQAVDDRVFFDPVKITVEEWFEVWISDYSGSMSDYTVRKYRSFIKNHIVPALGFVKLKDLTPVLIQRFINEKAAAKPNRSEKSKEVKDEPYSAKTIKDIHGVLHSGLKTACEINYISKNPADRTKLPKVVSKPVKPLDKAQTKAFLAALDGNEYERPFKTALFTGMREAEICGLTWDCVDFENGVITIDRQLQRVDGAYKFNPPKWGKVHTVAISQALETVLREERRNQLENRMRAGTAWDNPKDLVFTNEIGKNRVPQTLSQRFKKVAKSIGLDDSCLHDLRHTYAVNALQAGIDVKTVSESMGHRSVAFTMDRYMNVTKDMRKDCADKMDAFLKNL